MSEFTAYGRTFKGSPFEIAKAIIDFESTKEFKEETERMMGL
jgi:hypothetical protein